MPSASSPTPDLPVVPEDCPWPIYLGIDPGTLVVGYGAIVVRPDGPRLLAAGALKAGRSKDVPTRLGSLRRQLDDLMTRLRPRVVAVESAFAGNNVKSALRIGEGRGVALACAACAGAEVVEYAPAMAKRTLVGNGAADKAQVARMVAAELGLESPPEPLDASDALALALTHLHRTRTRDTLGVSTPVLRARGARGGARG